MKNTYFMSKKMMNERQFSSLIYRMVNESLDALSGYNFEANDNANDNNAQNDDSKRRNNRRRQQVEAFFKQPGVNPAAYAYGLYRVKPVEGDDTNNMKNARSKFMKCLNHEKNEDGYEYAFDSSEVNTLFSMISGNELKENKISLSESDIMYMVNESIKRILKEGRVVNNRKPKEEMSYVNDETGEFVEIPEEPFYKDYSSKQAVDKRKKRLKSQVLSDDGVLVWGDGFPNDYDFTIQSSLKILKLHPERLEFTPSEMRAGVLQWWPNPKKMPNSRRIAANYMWELWDVDGEPLFVLRNDYIKKHTDDIFGEGETENYQDVRNQTIDIFGV